MKKIVTLLLAYIPLFSATLVLDNQTSYPNDQAKMIVQWANTAKEVTDSNNAMMYSLPMDKKQLQLIAKQGKITLTIPKNSEYFRVLVAEKNEEYNLHTNWVDAIPDKTYTLTNDLLVPTVLMLGTGC